MSLLRFLRGAPRPNPAPDDPGTPVTRAEVLAHIARHNPHEGKARDAAGALGRSFWRATNWRREAFPVASLPPLSPASARDVKRYARWRREDGKPFPAVVIVRHAGGEVELVDGAHRSGAAVMVGDATVDAFVGDYDPDGPAPPGPDAA